MFRRFARARVTENSGTGPELDPHAGFTEAYQDYLEHARWLVEVQERRGAGFQTVAVAVLGFDGVILSILFGLRPVVSADVTALLAISAAVLIILSAVSSVLAVVPRSVSVAALDDLLKNWDDLFKPSSGDAARHPSATRSTLASTLLNLDVVEETSVFRKSTAGRNTKSRGPLQPLKAAEDLADKRAAHLKRSAWLLVSGLILASGSWIAPALIP